MEKVLVIGGTGFIGSHLIKNLIKKNYKIYSLSLNLVKKENQINKVKYIKCDINKKNDLAKKINISFNYVINCSGYINHSSTETSEGKQTFKTHYNAVINILNLINQQNNIKKFIQIGSSDEYGLLPSPQKELYSFSLETSYSKSKLKLTNYIMKNKSNFNFPISIIRLFLVYGPGQKDDRLIPYVIKRCLQNATFQIGDATKIRDFCYVDDVTNGIYKAMINQNSNGEIINIASGKPIKIREIIKKIHNKIKKGKAKFNAKRIDKVENKKLYACIKKAKQKLQWKPKISIDEGLNKTIVSYE